MEFTVPDYIRLPELGVIADCLPLEQKIVQKIFQSDQFAQETNQYSFETSTRRGEQINIIISGLTPNTDLDQLVLSQTLRLGPTQTNLSITTCPPDHSPGTTTQSSMLSGGKLISLVEHSGLENQKPNFAFNSQDHSGFNETAPLSALKKYRKLLKKTLRQI